MDNQLRYEIKRRLRAEAALAALVGVIEQSLDISDDYYGTLTGDERLACVCAKCGRQASTIVDDAPLCEACSLHRGGERCRT